jgi:acetyltransferase-like isoleucine patch superfamily enzyme
MVIRIVEKLINIIRGNNFRFDSELRSIDVLYLFIQNFKSLVRGLLFFGVYSKGLLFVGKNCNFKFRSRIKIGKNFRLGDFCYLSALGKNGILIGDNVSIGNFGHLISSTTFDNIGLGIEIESNVGIGEFCYIGGSGGVKIGSETIIGQYFSVHPENHIFQNSHKLIRLQSVTRLGIKIGSNCWIGSKVTILDGVEIGSNSIIAAGAVVNKSFPPNSVIGGVPARLLKTR